MIVTRSSLEQIIARLSGPGKRGLDTETTGLREDDSLFSLIISDEDESYYFNFNDRSDTPRECLLDRNLTFNLLFPIFNHPLNVWYIQNAKFDLRMLAKEGVNIVGRVHCTYAIERVIKNNYFGKDAYRLKGLAARRGEAKDDSVEKYVKANGLITTKEVSWKQDTIEYHHYDRVPFDIISKYGTHDGRLHRIIGIDQEKQIGQLSQDPKFPVLFPLVENEIRLTKTCFRMERRGIKIDRPYVEKALQYELDQVAAAKVDFEKGCGEPYQDSRALFKRVFDAAGEKYPTTEKGNPSFAADVLEEMSTPIAAAINRIRYHQKRAGTYYGNFLEKATPLDIVHADMQQAGTTTGRFSYRDPNLQNVPKEDEGCDDLPYLVRASFIPRPGHLYYSIDYQQQEYKLMLDLAGEMVLIKAVNEGADVHAATAQLLGISRRAAKTINFGILYGMGREKLAQALGLTLREANDLICDYFGKLPRVQRFITDVRKKGAARGFIFNWFGRRMHIDSSDFSYALSNHIIQGGCGDIIKVAMNQIDDMLIMENRQTHTLLQVHDELLVEAPVEEERIVERYVDIMEKVYKPKNGIRMTCSVDHSFKSWSARDKVKGTPYGKYKAS